MPSKTSGIFSPDCAAACSSFPINGSFKFIFFRLPHCINASEAFPVRTAAVSMTSQRSSSIPYAFSDLFRAHSRCLHDVSAQRLPAICFPCPFPCAHPQSPRRLCAAAPCHMLPVASSVRTSAVSTTSQRTTSCHCRGQLPAIFYFCVLFRAHSRCSHDVSAQQSLAIRFPCPFPCAQPLSPRRLSAAAPCHMLSVPFPVRTAAVSMTSLRTTSCHCRGQPPAIF